MGFSFQALVGQASEVMPLWIQAAGAVLVLALSVKPLYRLTASLKMRISRVAVPAEKSAAAKADAEDLPSSTACGPT